MLGVVIDGGYDSNGRAGTGASILSIAWKNDEERESGPRTCQRKAFPLFVECFPVAAEGVFLAHGGDGVHVQAPGGEGVVVRRADGEDETERLGLEMDVAPTPLCVPLNQAAVLESRQPGGGTLQPQAQTRGGKPSR